MPIHCRSLSYDKSHVMTSAVYTFKVILRDIIYRTARNRCSIFLTQHWQLTYYRSPVLEMAYSSNSNVFIQGGTFQSAQGDFHIYNRDSESGMHNFRLFRRASLLMTQWRTSYTLETRSFSWSDSQLGRTLPTTKLPSWYPQGHSTDHFGLDP